jgi:hypothetical protein
MFNLSNIKVSYGQTIQAGASHSIDRIGGVDGVSRGSFTIIALLTAQRRTAYELGEKAGQQAPRAAPWPAEAELNMTAEKYFEQQGPAQQRQNPSRKADLQAFKQAYKKGYEAGFKKNQPEQ